MVYECSMKVMTQRCPSPAPRDMGQVLYSSLLVLGLDAAGLEHSLRTPVNQKMFVRMNKKLGDTILHFLFECIDRERAAKVFRDCWPLIDKKQECQFHKATFDWYKNLQQCYGQPVPVVVAKTFMVPGGPKFTSTLITLTRIALQSSVARKAPECTLLHFPLHSRSSVSNWETLLLLRASKLAHHRNFVVKQKVHQEVLNNLQDKAMELSGTYRTQCYESEKAKQDYQKAFINNDRLNQHQKETLFMAPLPTVKKEILDDISKMNSEASKLWGRVEEFRKIEETSWKILSLLLDGTISLSHIDGSAFSPQVPEMVYKAHANTINKMGLQGLYRNNKLDLLSLMQYSNLALSSLLDTIRITHCQAKPESTEELNVQLGCVTSLSETVNKLSSRLNTLLPVLMENITRHRHKIASTLPSMEAVEFEGKPNLCPPTPPLSLVNTPVVVKGGGKFVPLQLTPGTQHRKVELIQGGFRISPDKLFSTSSSTQAAMRSPKAEVLYSPATHKDDSIQIMVGDNTKRLVTEAGLTMDVLTVDCRGRYLKKREQEQQSLQASCNPPLKSQGYKSSIPKRCRIPKNLLNVSAINTDTAIVNVADSGVQKVTDVNVNDESSNGTTCSNKTKNEEFNKSLLDKLANIIASEDVDGSAATELLDTLLLDDNGQNSSTSDSGCLEMTLDSETLLEAIEKMDITPKRELVRLHEGKRPLKGTPGSVRKTGTPFYSTSPRIASLSKETPERWKTRTQGTPNQFNWSTHTPPCGSHIYSKHPLDKAPVTDSFFIKSSRKQQVTSSDAELVNLSINNGLLSKQEEKECESSQDLLANMSFLTQSPYKDSAASSSSSKILNKFDGLDLSLGGKVSNSTRPSASEEASQDGTVEELRHHFKTKFNRLIEQMQQMKLQHPAKVDIIKQTKTAEAGTKANFRSFVENVKSRRDVNSQFSDVECNEAVARSEPYKTEFMTTSSYSVKDLSLTNSRLNKFDGDKTVMDAKQEFYSSLTRMQNLLLDDEDDTLTENNMETKHIEKTLEMEETFTNAVDIAEDVFRSPGHPGRRSSYLPESSVFDTLTDSVLTGESAFSILNNEAVKTELRRESIASRRQSLVSVERMSLGSSKQLSDIVSTLQNRMSIEFSGILDESDSCLLSTSLDDF